MLRTVRSRAADPLACSLARCWGRNPSTARPPDRQTHTRTRTLCVHPRVPQPQLLEALPQVEVHDGVVQERVLLQALQVDGMHLYVVPAPHAATGWRARSRSPSGLSEMRPCGFIRIALACCPTGMRLCWHAAPLAWGFISIALACSPTDTRPHWHAALLACSFILIALACSPTDMRLCWHAAPLARGFI